MKLIIKNIFSSLYAWHYKLASQCAVSQLGDVQIWWRHISHYLLMTSNLNKTQNLREHHIFSVTKSQNGPPRDKTNKVACAPSEDSDQPGHPPSLIRVFRCALNG